MSKRDLLLEIGCEELPARESLIAHLAELLTAELKAHQLNYGKVSTFATPRRLAVCITEVTEQQPAQKTARSGPAVEQAFDPQGKPTTAAIGFAQSCGVGVDVLSITDTPKGK